MMRMPVSVHQLLLICGGASAGLLLLAFGFEYLGGLAPCKLCIWQRWPHAAVILFSLCGLAGLRPGVALMLISLSAATTAAIAGYHVGVEQQLWAGPASCSSALASGSTAALVDSLLATPVIRCDEIAWYFAGLSMAGWNMLASFCIAAFALLGLTPRRR